MKQCIDTRVCCLHQRNVHSESLPCQLGGTARRAALTFIKIHVTSGESCNIADPGLYGAHFIASGDIYGAIRGAA